MKKKNSFTFLILALELFLNLILINASELDEISEHMLIKLKKEIKNDKKDMTEDKYMNELMYKQFYSNFDVGIPSQKIKFYYETNVYESTISKDDYEMERSTTYKLIGKNRINTNDNDNEINNLSQEVLIFHPKKKLENFTFILKEKIAEEDNKNSNIFGLNLNVNNKSESLSFLRQLKQINFINKEMFSFLFEDYVIGDNNGFEAQILIGCLPHEINSLYDEKDLRWISSKRDFTSNRSWHIDFDIVKYNIDTLTDKKVNLDLSLNIIVGPESFRKKLLSDFFKTNMEKKNCKENVFYSIKDEEHYIYYSCNGQTEFIEIPTISFYNKELNETFKFPFTNLFTKYKGKFFFNIIFSKKPRNYWILGQLFFSTYRFVFDLEQERIGYYKTIPYKSNLYIVFISFIIAAIVFAILYFSGYITKAGNEYRDLNDKNRKIYYPVRSEYSQNNNEENKNDKNVNNNIKKDQKIKKE